MDSLRIIEVKESIFADNAIDADNLRMELREKKVFMINLMASPGAGKTTLLKETISLLKDEMRIGVMEADIDASVDAEAIQAAGGMAVQVHTGGMCHMDASMTRQGLEGLDLDTLDFLVLENVGNLVCPAEFDTGACENVMILSIPEGDDKPLKYPLIFQVCDTVIISKIDTCEVFDFDKEKVVTNIHKRNPKAKVLFLSAKTGEGMDTWCDWVRTKVTAWKTDEGK